MKLVGIVAAAARDLEAAKLSFGHGTTNAWDEAAWLVLWQLGLPLDTDLDDPDSRAQVEVTPVQQAAVEALLAQRIATRQPAAYLTHEAWLQGVSFHVDARVIVPRSLIAELLVVGALDFWLPEHKPNLLDLCTGGGSLAILAALTYPDARIDATDVSADALAVAAINLQRHGLQQRVRLLQGDCLAAARGPYDLIVCNPPYVNTASMATLPPEYRAEPALALDGGPDGMEFVRRLLPDCAAVMRADAALVLEIGHERAHFETAFPTLQATWLDTSAGADQVCVITRAALLDLQAQTRPEPSTAAE